MAARFFLYAFMLVAHHAGHAWIDVPEHDTTRRRIVALVAR
jgi:hypothetical protein